MPENDSLGIPETTTPPPILDDLVDTVGEDQTANESPNETPADEQQPNESESEWSKRLQKEQMKRANAERRVQSLSGEIDSLKTMVADLQKASTASQKADLLAEIDTFLASEAGQEEAKFVPGLAKMMKAMADELKASRGKGDTTKLDQLQAQLEYSTYWADYPKSYREAFDAKVSKLREKGLRGDVLRGAAGEWFDNYVESQASTETTATPPRAASSPGRNRVIPATTGARQQSTPSAQELLEHGTGNIGGFQFRKK